MKFTDPDVRPQVAAPIYENIPSELQELPHWVLWRYVWNKHTKQWGKVPYDAQTLRPAKSNDASTWASFDAAHMIFVQGKGEFGGIGFVFSADDEFVGIDFDNCIQDGKIIDPFVTEWIEKFDSYTEKSVSGTGFHTIVKGACGGGFKTGNFEIYDRLRYFTFSGRVGKRKIIQRRQLKIEEFKKVLKPEEKRAQPVRPVTGGSAPTVHEVLERAFNAKNGASLRALYEGNLNGHKSHSEAVASLCWSFGFWTDRNPALLDAVVRGSGLFDSKWDSPRGDSTWGSREVDEGIARCSEFFDWNKPSGGNSSASPLVSETNNELEAIPWPELNPAALYGLAGDIVRTIEPHTEADPVAILAQLLAAFGNVIGSAPYFPVEANRHRLNIFVRRRVNSCRPRSDREAGANQG
jgi:hypothetical protein